MRKIIPFILAAAVMFACFTAPACAGSPSAADEAAILAQAEQLLARPFADAYKINEWNPFPADVALTGPFVYVGEEGNASQLFIPDMDSHEYFPGGLAEGAALFEYDSADILDMYPGIIDDGAKAPVVYALLLGTGYYNGVKYQGDLTVCDQKYVVLFVDFTTDNIIAWSDVTTWRGGPFMLYGTDYFTDQNSRKVFYRDHSTLLSNIWRDALLYASADPAGAVIRDGTFATMNNKELSEYAVPDGVTEIGVRAFLGCDRLESVVLPEGVVSIGDGAFSGCTSLTDISLPSTLQNVGIAAFADTPWLAAQEGEPFVIAGDGVLIQANATFTGTDMPAGQYEELIAAYGDPSEWSEDMRMELEAAFGVLIPQADLVIPEGVKYLAAESIANLSLERLVLPGTLQAGWSKDIALWNVTVKEIYLSDGITELPFDAFTFCSGVQRIRLPESLTTFNIPADVMGLGDVVIVCPQGSRIYATAEQLGYAVEAED